MMIQTGVQTMKHEMLLSLNRRYLEVETIEHLVLSTLLDPCFKDKCFSSITNHTRAKSILEEKVKALEGSSETNTDATEKDQEQQ